MTKMTTKTAELYPLSTSNKENFERRNVGFCAMYKDS